MNENETPKQPAEAPVEENPMIKKRWFGRGIYGSKDVPIRVLDACIAVMIAAAVILTIVGSINGGFTIRFDTGLPDVTVESQKLRHGEYITEPEAPLRPGYTLAGWSTTQSPDIHYWDFATRTVEMDLTLYAIWEPAELTVSFDLAGGTGDDTPLTVTYGSAYGELPTPTKEGSTFAGWEYNGKLITAETIVTATDAHTLTAVWE